MALNAQILLSILAHESDNGDISQTLRATPVTYALALTDGTGANEAQIVYSESRTIPSGGQEDSFGLRSLADDRGAISFTTIKALFIRNTHPSIPVQLVLGDALQESWSSGPGYAVGGSNFGETNIAPGGCLFYSDPTAGGATSPQSGDAIYINGDPGGTYEIILIGEGTIT
jgi:hypothetical protein